MPGHSGAESGLPVQVRWTTASWVGSNDVATLEERLVEAIEGQRLGEYDGNEFGPGEVTLFLYGPDAERLFSGIEAVLRGYPLCRNARVVIRQSGPGAPQREVRL